MQPAASAMLAAPGVHQSSPYRARHARDTADLPVTRSARPVSFGPWWAPLQRKRREMFPNTALNSISPDVRMMKAFPNIFLLKEIVGHPTACATRGKQRN